MKNNQIKLKKSKKHNIGRPNSTSKKITQKDTENKS